MTPARPPLLTARILLWRGRHVLVALACAAVVLGVVRTLAPAPPPTASVLVTARAVTAGQPIGDGDLRAEAWPQHLAPDGGLGHADVEGRTSLVDLPAGVPLVAGLLTGDRYDIAVPPGAVVVPVRLADQATTTLLRPGDRVDLVRPTDAGPADVVAHGALVLRAEAPAAESGPLGLGGAPAAAHVVVAVGLGEGRALAAAGAWGELGAVLVGD